MRSAHIRDIKRAKGFYSRGFQRTVNVLIISVILNFVFVGTIQYRAMHMPVQRFYATDGVAMPQVLAPLGAPNMSSVPLLKDDVPAEMTIRQVPDSM